MDPVPPRLRTWSTWNYVAYWISDAANVPMYEFASSILAIGLSWYVSPFSLDSGRRRVNFNGVSGVRLFRL